VLDLCCGTGAIGLSVAHFRPDARVLLTDVSADALSLAEENAGALGVSNAEFARGDLFDAAGEEAFDLIACNPPYLDEADMAALQQEVRREPALALFGGPDGLDFYRRLAAGWQAHVAIGGRLLMEIGASQGAAVCRLFPGAKVLKDIRGLDRVVCVERK
jgi:release factor glutamine methyltransferase